MLIHFNVGKNPDTIQHTLIYGCYALWSTKGTGQSVVSLNMSPRHLSHGNYCYFVNLQDYPELMDQAYQRALRSELGYGNDYQDWLQQYYDQLQR